MTKTIVWVVVGANCWGKSPDSLKDAFVNCLSNESRNWPTKTFHFREVIVDTGFAPEDESPEREAAEANAIKACYIDDMGTLYTPKGAEVRKLEVMGPTLDKLKKAYTAFGDAWEDFVYSEPVDLAFGGDA